MNILRLVNEDTVWQLFNLKSQKEFHLSHSTHFKFFFHDFLEVFTQLLICRPKDDIIYVNLYYNQMLIYFLGEESVVYCPSGEPVFQKVLRKRLIPGSRGLVETV
mgnify:CR=1 FL=1